MAKRYYENETDQVMQIGGVMLLPGTGREIDVQYLPAGTPEQTPPPADAPGPVLSEEELRAAAAEANLRDIQSKPLNHVLPLLPDMSNETLDGLERIEKASDTPRKTLLSAIAQLRLDRAQAATGGAPS